MNFNIDKSIVSIRHYFKVKSFGLIIANDYVTKM